MNEPIIEATADALSSPVSDVFSVGRVEVSRFRRTGEDVGKP